MGRASQTALIARGPVSSVTDMRWLSMAALSGDWRFLAAMLVRCGTDFSFGRRILPTSSQLPMLSRILLASWMRVTTAMLAFWGVGGHPSGCGTRRRPTFFIYEHCLGFTESLVSVGFGTSESLDYAEELVGGADGVFARVGGDFLGCLVVPFQGPLRKLDPFLEFLYEFGLLVKCNLVVQGFS